MGYESSNCFEMISCLVKHKAPRSPDLLPIPFFFCFVCLLVLFVCFIEVWCLRRNRKLEIAKFYIECIKTSYLYKNCDIRHYSSHYIFPLVYENKVYMNWRMTLFSCKVRREVNFINLKILPLCWLNSWKNYCAMIHWRY